MTVLEACSRIPVTRVPGSQSRRTQVKKVRKNYLNAENVLYSFDQPMGNRNEGVAGVIEYLDIIQCF